MKSFYTVHEVLMASMLGGVGVGCHPLLQRIMFCQNSLLWPVHLGWPCVIGLIASLSYQVLLPQQGSDPSRVKVKGESERADLRLNIIKAKIMASGPNIAWQIEGEKVEVVTDFFFFGSKITVDSDCSHEIRRQLLFGRKAMTNLDSVLKGGDVTVGKGWGSQGYGLPCGHIRCESWTVKKAEHQKNDAFKLWCWRRLLKVPWTARRSNQSILREANPEYSLERLMLKLQYFRP